MTGCKNLAFLWALYTERSLDFRILEDRFGVQVYCAALAAQYKNIPLFNILAAPKGLTAQGLSVFSLSRHFRGFLY